MQTTFKDDVEKQYDAMLALAEQHDTCFEEREEKVFGNRSMSVKEDAKATYWDTRKKLESQLAEWMNLLRKAVGEIPLSEKKYTTDTRIDYPTEEQYTVKVYSNETFASLLGFFEKIQSEVEGSNGVLDKISSSRPILTQFRNLRGDILSFSHTLDLFIPEKMISIEREVEIILRLRELGLEKVAIEIEGMENEEDYRLKCLKARTALEQVVLDFCEKNGIKPSTFYFNLVSTVEKGMVEKGQQKAIAAHYSFISKIVHKDTDADQKNRVCNLWRIQHHW